MTTWLINGVTPQALGLRMARRELVSFGTSRTILEITDLAFGAQRAATLGDEIQIRRNGSFYFGGKVRAIGRNGRGQTIEIRDAWEELENHQVSQLWNGKRTNALFLGAGGAINEDGQLEFDSTAAPQANVTVAQELTRTLQNAQAGGVSINLGNIEGSTELWAYQQSNRSAAEILRDVTAFSPRAVAYFSYGEPPTLHIRGTGDSIIIPATAAITAAITPRDDMLIDGVELSFENYTSGIRVDAATQIAGGGGRRTLRATVAMQGVGQWGTAFGQSPIPVGLAAALYDSYGEIYYEGEVTIHAGDPWGTAGLTYGDIAWLGVRLNITGGPVEWETMNARVIGVSEDFGTGRITLRLGPARQADNPNRALRNKPPVAPSAPPSVVASATPAEQSYEPLQTYIAPGTNVIHVAEGLCGQNAAHQDVMVDHTGPSYSLATISPGGTVDIWLQVVVAPDVLPFTMLDGEEIETEEYLAVGTGKVISASVELSTASPAARPSIVDYTDGSITQTAIMYFRLARVTWGGAAPAVHIFRQGNLDVLLIPPNRVYLTAME